ncbi:MAG: bifunctional (p)ppGpp synthetase/guanosine-3',5'-bis(diphosphate) 3'-pyrophosphohydrolase [Alphaproteobacteria bacterium]|nr:bifunctional (p)ppGpp synthetase/guanosine-3',5'-bis(diphosphate) 3'-pyrophosphohydrolase [Alphaproteobacteria bacterium]
MIRQFELVEKVKAYDPQVDEDALNRAYVYSMQAHGSQQRASGDPYFTHPLEVANILTQYRLDGASIITALLHDTVEDTHATLEEIEEHFGKEISQLVDGVTKLSRLEYKSEQEKQAENFRKLLVAMSEDIRVLLVKLADRLHNMRTLHHVTSPEKRRRIARETMEIYAPLAERLGMQDFKEELQDLAFAEIQPEARESIIARLKFLRQEGQGVIEKIVTDIRKTLTDAQITAEVSGREKTPYSIWKKMEAKHVSFEQLADIMAFRIVVADIGMCYQALGAVHAAYHMIPGHFKDYLSTPKSNGYQSLHTAVLGPERQRIEIQIRTKEMHEIAEFGVAAHWAYKQGMGKTTEGKQYRWVRELLEILEHASNPEEFLENTKLEMYHDQVFAFTPKGDVFALPKGATPVDFAFAVHSNVGFTCVGAKVNGRIVPLKTPLENGDQVEIVRSKAQTPSPAWERFVVTGKAKSEIRRFLRTQQRNEYINLGRAILAKTFKQEGFELQDKMLEPAMKILGRKTLDDLLAAVGEGLVTRAQVFEAVYPNHKSVAETTAKKGFSLARLLKKPAKAGDKALPIKGLMPGLAVHFAGCCHPIPGDRIVGIITTGKGITIHTIDCETLQNFTDSPERWMDVSWEKDGTESQLYTGRLRMQVSHETGALANLANSIAKDGGNITNLKIINRAPDFFEILLDIQVRDIRHLNAVIAALRANSAVQSVERNHM